MRKLRMADRQIVLFVLWLNVIVQLMNILQAFTNQMEHALKGDSWTNVARPSFVLLVVLTVILGLISIGIKKFAAWYNTESKWPETYDAEFNRRWWVYSLVLIFGCFLCASSMYGGWKPMIVFMILVLVVEERAFRRKYRTTRVARVSWQIWWKNFKNRVKEKAAAAHNPRAKDGLSGFKNESVKKETDDASSKKQTGPRPPEQTEDKRKAEIERILKERYEIVKKARGPEAAALQLNNLH